MKCHIVKDLLANYIDGLSSEETNQEIKKHLNECEDCRVAYEKMSAIIPQEIPPEEKDVDFLKKLKKKMRKKQILVAILTCICVLVGFFLFAINYTIILPFDANRMLVEEFKIGIVTKEDGETIWEDSQPDGEEIVMVTKEDGTTTWFDMSKDRSKEYDNIIDGVKISYRGINHLIEEASIGRTINRDGKDVRVVYYSYSKTLWHLIFDSDLLGYSEGGSSWGEDIYGKSFQTTHHKPQMVEIYYIPEKNLYKLENLSDEEYDKQKEKGALIWSGIV